MYHGSRLCSGLRLLLSPCQTERMGCHHPLNQVGLEDWVHPKIQNTTGLLFWVTEFFASAKLHLRAWWDNGLISRQTDRRTDRRQVDRQTDRQTDEWTNKDRLADGSWTDGRILCLGKNKNNYLAYVFVVDVNKYSSFISIKSSWSSYQQIWKPREGEKLRLKMSTISFN